MALGKLLGVKNVFFLRINGKLVFNTGESKEEGVWEVKGSEGAQPSQEMACTGALGETSAVVDTLYMEDEGILGSAQGCSSPFQPSGINTHIPRQRGTSNSATHLSFSQSLGESTWLSTAENPLEILSWRKPPTAWKPSRCLHNLLPPKVKPTAATGLGLR